MGIPFCFMLMFSCTKYHYLSYKDLADETHNQTSLQKHRTIIDVNFQSKVFPAFWI